MLHLPQSGVALLLSMVLLMWSSQKRTCRIRRCSPLRGLGGPSLKLSHLDHQHDHHQHPRQPRNRQPLPRNPEWTSSRLRCRQSALETLTRLKASTSSIKN